MQWHCDIKTVRQSSGFATESLAESSRLPKRVSERRPALQTEYRKDASASKFVRAPSPFVLLTDLPLPDEAHPGVRRRLLPFALVVLSPRSFLTWLSPILTNSMK